MTVVVDGRDFHGGKAVAPPSKSLLHRLLIAAALADRPTKITGLSRGMSDDIKATARCLTAMGAEICGNVVIPVSSPAQAPLLDCGQSGSTLRFLLPVASAVCGAGRATGSGRLPERPVTEVIDVMEQAGVSFSSLRLPLTFKGRLAPGRYEVSAKLTSQYVTGMMFALCAAGGGELVTGDSIVSENYVDLTTEVLRRFSVDVQKTEDGYVVPDARPVSPGVVSCEGDWSNSAFLLACAAMSGKHLNVKGLFKDTKQGDIAFLELLKLVGCRVKINKESVTVENNEGATRYEGDIDVGNIPDLVPVAAVISAAMKHEMTFVNASRLRLKESDRLESTAAMIRSLGGKAEVGEDFLHVLPTGLRGGAVDSYGDHRIVMAAAAASCACEEPVVINGAEAVSKSYPGFFDDLRELGGKTNVL